MAVILPIVPLYFGFGARQMLQANLIAFSATLAVLRKRKVPHHLGWVARHALDDSALECAIDLTELRVVELPDDLFMSGIDLE